MSTASDLLSPYRCEAFDHRQDRPDDQANALPHRLRDLYAEFNGGFFWGRSLVIRPALATSSPVLTVGAWNAPTLWKGLYGEACTDIVFFAEDAFGGQFGIRSGGIVTFDPETAQVEEAASTLEEWAGLLISDPSYFTGAPVLASWESTHAPISAGHRLLPKQLFMLGGEFVASNMLSKADVEGMRIRAQLHELTKDLPDGARIVFEIKD